MDGWIALALILFVHSLAGLNFFVAMQMKNSTLVVVVIIF